jgi:hypothetical protein
MRDTQGLDPMWENDAQHAGGSRVVKAVVGTVGGVARRIAPHLLKWAAAQRPQMTLSWGLREYHLQKDGVLSTRRQGSGWDDNPRRNYNDAVERKQQRAATKEAVEAQAAPVEPSPEPEAPKIDLSVDALEAAVRSTMGISDDPEGSDDAAEVSRDPEQVKEQISSVRSLLQALDDVADYDLVEAVDEELYQLHKAVEYKLRNHKASEAKAQLNDLFK